MTYTHKTLELANIPSGYWTNDIVDEIWDSHIYDKLIPIEQNWTVVDIGASIGVFSIYASQQVGKNGRVIAFEPERASYNALLDNLDANGITNVQAVKMGVWGSQGIKKIMKNDFNLGGSTMFASKGEDVEVDRLDHILPAMGLTHVDFVKIDTEGAATEILKGASGIMQNIDNFAIAAYHAPHEDPVEIRRILEHSGFKTKLMSRFGLSPYVYASRTINLEASVELWQILTVTGVASLVAYQVMKK